MTEDDYQLIYLPAFLFFLDLMLNVSSSSSASWSWLASLRTAIAGDNGLTASCLLLPDSANEES
jgi:hypothetical protein